MSPGEHRAPDGIGDPPDPGTGSAALGVLVVDDQAPFRAVARTVVGLCDGFEVLAEAATGEEAVELGSRLHPDVVLMDINLPGIDGMEATRRLLDSVPNATVVLLSTYDHDSLPADAATCGSVAYVPKAEFGPAVLTRLAPN